MVSTSRPQQGDGTWAIPPYPDNNSVPNLYELLIPAKDRSKTFFVGAEFDPVKVGVDTSEKPGKFRFDTSLYGNSNAGHSFEDGPRGKGVIGPLLKEEERWALVEYLKSIPSKPNQVAPFGGPEDAVPAWKDKTFFHNKIQEADTRRAAAGVSGPAGNPSSGSKKSCSPTRRR